MGVDDLPPGIYEDTVHLRIDTSPAQNAFGFSVHLTLTVVDPNPPVFVSAPRRKRGMSRGEKMFALVALLCTIILASVGTGVALEHAAQRRAKEHSRQQALLAIIPSEFRPCTVASGGATSDVDLTANCNSATFAVLKPSFSGTLRPRSVG